MKKLSLLYILSILVFFSCSKDAEPMVGPITLEFDNRIEDHPGFTITYDITDIKLKRDDGLVFHNGDRHQVNASDESSQEIGLKDLSSGGYVEVTFVVENINVAGGFEYKSDSPATVTLTMPRTPVRAEHQPEVHLIFNIDQLSSGIQAAFVVDHIHEN